MTTTTQSHVFETAGLGQAPFQFIGCEERRGPELITMPDGVVMECGAPGQPMGTCDYCGQGIAICCNIQSADGKRFMVGTDCVRKTGDSGLKRVVASVINERRKEARHAREDTRIKDASARLPRIADAIKSQPHPNEWRADKGETLFDWCIWMMEHAGRTGKLHVAQVVEAT